MFTFEPDQFTLDQVSTVRSNIAPMLIRLKNSVYNTTVFENTFWRAIDMVMLDTKGILHQRAKINFETALQDSAAVEARQYSDKSHKLKAVTNFLNYIAVENKFEDAPKIMPKEVYYQDGAPIHDGHRQSEK